MLHSYRPLMRFWAAVVLLSGSGAGALQVLGPPPSGGRVAALPSAAVEAVQAPAPPAEATASAAPAVEDAAAPVAAPGLPGVLPGVLPAAGGAAMAGAAQMQPGPRKAALPKSAPPQRAASASGAAERRMPTRDIWGNPLLPPGAVWADRPPGRGEGGYVGVYSVGPRPYPYSSGRGEGDYIGVYTVGPDGSRTFRPGP